MARPITPQQLAHAQKLFADGASQAEVVATTQISRKTVQKYFPGQGWTYRQGGQFRALTRTHETKGVR